MFSSKRQTFRRSRVATVEVYRHATTTEISKRFRMPRRTCRWPRPTVPPPLKYRDENKAATSVCEISSTRSTRIETPTTLRKPRSPGYHTLQQLGQSAHTDRTKDESTPTDIVLSGSSSLGGEVRRTQERAKNDLKMSAVVRGEDVQTIWWGSVQVVSRTCRTLHPWGRLNYFQEKGTIGGYA